MSLDAVPIGLLFAITVTIVMLSIEVGYRWGNMARARWKNEGEPPASYVSAAVLGLASFMLAFAFGIVWDRYDARKDLVREEANVIRTAYVRADFLPEPDRTEAKQLLRQYVDARVAVVQTTTPDSARLQASMEDAISIHRRLWAMAVANARKDMNSDVAALYIESLNDLAAVHESRVVVGIQSRVPLGIWLALYGLTVLAMMSMGYHTGVVASRRSMSTLILAAAFAVVIILIATLDRPGGLIRVSQQPLTDLKGALDGKM